MDLNGTHDHHFADLSNGEELLLELHPFVGCITSHVGRQKQPEARQSLSAGGVRTEEVLRLVSEVVDFPESMESWLTSARGRFAKVCQEFRSILRHTAYNNALLVDCIDKK